MISWIKLDINILDDAKIKIIRSHPDGNAIIVLWIGLLCLAMKSTRPGTIEISNGLPYTLDDLSNLFNLEKKTTELGIALLVKYRMIEIFEGGCIEIINFSKHQNLEEIERRRELTRVRTVKYRDKLRISDASQRHGDDNRQDKTRQDKDKSTADAPFVLPTKEEIQESSEPKILEDIKNVCEALYKENIFPEVNSFKNKMLKKKKNERGILHVLTRCYLSKPEEPWGFCQKVLESEDMNYNASDYQKTAR